jgi:hypothetical protein
LPESERENFNQAVFALAFFSRQQDRELLGAISRGLLDCPVDFRVHPTRNGFSVSNPCCSTNRFRRSSGGSTDL